MVKNTYKLQTFCIAIIVAIVVIASFIFSVVSPQTKASLLSPLSILNPINSLRTILTPAKASAAPSTYLNFQARIKSSSGGLIPDGNYNLEFKLYSSASGGSALWTETRTGGAKVRVVNGYMTVSLGSVTAFPSNIAWGEEHWITMNIGGTSSPSWDGEMNPRLQLTAVPHAFKADQANSLTDGTNTYTANDFLKISPSTSQSTSSSSAALNINQTGSGALLNLQSAGTDVLSLTNTGQATIKNTANSVSAFTIQDSSGTSVLTADTANSRIYVGSPTADGTGTTLVLDTKNTSGDPTGTDGAMYYNSNTNKFRCYESGAWKDCIGGVQVGAITQGGNSLGQDMSIGTNDNYGLSLKTNNQTQMTISTTGQTTLKNSTDSDTAFRVQNALGLDVLRVDTEKGLVSINGSVQTSSWLQSTSNNNNWQAVTYGNGLFVAVASGGTNRVMTSPDGITWTLQPSSPTYAEWRAVTYGNGLFVAVASTGTDRVMTSPDGISWTIRSGTGGGQWRAVTYGNGLFVAVASAGSMVMTSPDGINWTYQTAITNSWYGVAYGNGLFVAVANGGSSRVMTSPDGITWTSRSVFPITSTFRSVTYGNGLFVAVAWGCTNNDCVMTSPDGITWTSRVAAENNQWQAITYGGGAFVAVSNSGSYRSMISLDGISWASRSTVDDSTGGWTGIAYGNGVFAVVAGTGVRSMFQLSGYNPDALVVSGGSAISGNLTYNVGGTNTATAVCRNSQGQLAGCTSASRYKQDVSNLDIGLDELRLLQPVAYTWKSTGQNDIGFLAEQVASVIPQAVTYNEDGEVASFNYNTISALLVSGVKDLDIVVSNIESRLAVVEQGSFNTNVSITGNLTVSGITNLANIRIGGKIITTGNTPTSTTEDSTATISINGNDIAGTITYIAGNNPQPGKQATITFNVPYEGVPRVNVMPVNSESGQVLSYMQRTIESFTIYFTLPPITGTTYQFDYQILQ